MTENECDKFENKSSILTQFKQADFCLVCVFFLFLLKNSANLKETIRWHRINWISVKMPQLTNTAALPIYVDAIDRERKYAADTSVRYSDASTDSVNKEDSDVASNCDSLNKVEIKIETDDAAAVPMADETDLLSGCDTIKVDKNGTTTKPTTTYLCHRCRQVFGSRDMFETHYK